MIVGSVPKGACILIPTEKSRTVIILRYNNINEKQWVLTSQQISGTEIY